MRIQTLANIIKIFQNIYHYIYILLSSVKNSSWTPYTCLVFQQKHIQNLFEHLRWNVFASPANDFKSLAVCAKTFYLRCLTPAFRLHLTIFCVIITNVWCIGNIYSKSQKRQRFIVFILVNTIQYQHTLKNNIYHSNKRIPPPFFHSDINPVFGHFLIHSFDKTHVLVVTVELIWLLLLNILSFNFVPTPNKFLLGWQDSEEAM